MLASMSVLVTVLLGVPLIRTVESNQDIEQRCDVSTLQQELHQLRRDVDELRCLLTAHAPVTGKLRELK